MAMRIGVAGMRKRVPWLALAMLFTLAGSATAEEGTRTAASPGAPSGANPAAEQRLREELRALVAELVESGAFGDRSAREISLAIDSPAQRVSNLGLLVDSAHEDGDGLRVLAVTPGGGAERMGLRAGDKLLALNGTRLAGVGGAAAILRRSVDELPNGSPLTFEAMRDGRVQTFSGKLSSVELPAMRLTLGADAAKPATGIGSSAAEPPIAAAQGCGRVSDFDVAPRQQHLHGAKIMSIDGAVPGPGGSKSYQVSAGHHVLKIAEQIESRYLAFNDRLRNAGAGSRYKTLEVDVEPNTTLFVAARLDDAKRNDWRDGAYWEPVVWRTSAEACD